MCQLQFHIITMLWSIRIINRMYMNLIVILREYLIKSLAIIFENLDHIFVLHKWHSIYPINNKTLDFVVQKPIQLRENLFMSFASEIMASCDFILCSMYTYPSWTVPIECAPLDSSVINALVIDSVAPKPPSCYKSAICYKERKKRKTKRLDSPTSKVKREGCLFSR